MGEVCFVPLAMNNIIKGECYINVVQHLLWKYKFLAVEILALIYWCLESVIRSIWLDSKIGKLSDLGLWSRVLQLPNCLRNTCHHHHHHHRRSVAVITIVNQGLHPHHCQHHHWNHWPPQKASSPITTINVDIISITVLSIQNKGQVGYHHLRSFL